MSAIGIVYLINFVFCCERPSVVSQHLRSDEVKSDTEVVIYSFMKVR